MISDLLDSFAFVESIYQIFSKGIARELLETESDASNTINYAYRNQIQVLILLQVQSNKQCKTCINETTN